MGFVKANIEVLGPHDEPYIPDDDEDESQEKTVISPKIRSKGHLIVAEIFKAESLIPIKLNSRKLDPYVAIKYGGNSQEIEEVEDATNPTFNKTVFLKAMLPNHSKFVYIELWNSNALLADDLIGTARVPFNTFKNSLNQKPKWINIYGPPPSADKKYSKVMAINGYRIGSTYRGRILIRFSSRDSKSPVSGVEDMGFMLPKVSVPAPLSKNYTLRIDVCSGSELPSSSQGILHFSLGNYFFKSSLKQVYKGENTSGVTSRSSKIIWNENLPDRKVFLPMDPKQIPDLIIYFCAEDVESHRTVFYRLNAKEILATNSTSTDETSKTRLIKFREDKSKDKLNADQFAGFVVIRVQLFSYKPTIRDYFNFVTKENIKTYELSFFIYVGRDLPSGDENGSCYPVLEFICQGHRETIMPKSYKVGMPRFEEDPKTKKTILHKNDQNHPYIQIYNQLCKNRKQDQQSDYLPDRETMECLKFNSEYMTREKHNVSQNPNFYQCVTMDIEIIKDKLMPPPTIIILLKHQRYKGNKKAETVLLGRYWMSLETEKNVNLKDKEFGNMLNFVFQRPSWIPMIYDKKEKIDGKILMSYTLVELDETVREMRFNKRNHTYWNAELFCNALNNGYIREFPEFNKEKLKLNKEQRELMIEETIECFYPLMADYHMWPESSIQKLNIFMLGFRDVRLGKKMPEMSCIVRIHGVVDKFEQGFKKFNENDPLQPKALPPPKDTKTTSNKKKTKKKSLIEQNKDPNIVEEGEESQEIEFSLEEDLSTIKVNRLLNVDVQVPNVVELAPIMEVFLFKGKGDRKKLISTGSLNMKQAFAYYYGIEDNIDYKERMRNFMKIRAVGSGGGGDLKPDVKVKIPRVNAQNKMNYFGVNYVVEMPDIKKAMKNEEMEGIQEFHQKKENIKGTETMKLHINDEFGDEEVEKHVLHLGPGEDVDNEEGQIEENKGNMNIIQTFGKRIKQRFKEDGGEFIKKIAKKNIKKKHKKKIMGDESEQLIQKNKNLKYQIKQFKNRNLAQSEDEFDDEDEDFNKIDVNAHFQNKQESKPDGAFDTREEENLEEMRVDRANFSFTSEQIRELNDDVIREEIDNLQIGANKIHRMDSEISQKEVRYEDEFIEENEDAKNKRRRDMRNKFFKKFKIGGGLKSFFRKLKKKAGIEYVEFDTDEDEEDLDEVLPFLKGRYIYGDDLEDMLYPKHKIRNIAYLDMYRGSQRADAKSLFQRLIGSKPEEYHQKGSLKLMFYRDDEVLNTDRIKSFMTKLMKPRKYIVRAYILRGIKMSGIQVDDESLKTFVKVTLNQKKASISTGSEVKREGFYPEYYEAYEFREIEMPGTAFLEIEVWESTLIGTTLLGKTEVDLEGRIFNSRWTKWEDRPVENRSVVNEIHGVRGRIEMWIDIFNEGDKTPMVPIFPIERLPYELRVIVWDTKDCVIKDTIAECNDVFVRGGVMRGNQFLETDTHWRCRTDGSFNYRWKYDITLPVEDERNYGEDKFKLQIWDRDLIMSNDLIGETEINLNMHKMLKKAYKRKEPVEMRMKVRGSGIDTNQILFDVYHPEVIDDYTGNKITQGKVLMSFEVLPKENADNLKNAVGRAEPNFFPTLPQPVGRFSFDIFSPCETIKQIIGPKMCYKIIYLIICIILCIILVMVGYFVFTTFLGVSMANIFKL